jgi:hypothetical protein
MRIKERVSVDANAAVDNRIRENIDYLTFSSRKQHILACRNGSCCRECHFRKHRTALAVSGTGDKQSGREGDDECPHV